ncbi:MAG: hypothetical protein KBD31_02085 [Proteobacteria bacterium]|nr:hypothetical protein [Pseudomonadota bacterium]
MKKLCVLLSALSVAKASEAFLTGADAVKLLNRNAGVSCAVIPGIESDVLFSVKNMTEENKNVYVTVKMQDAYGECSKYFSDEALLPGQVFSVTRRSLGDEFNSYQAAADGVRLKGILVQEIKRLAGEEYDRGVNVYEGRIGAVVELS